MTRAGERTALAIVLAGILTACAIRAARCDVDLSGIDCAASAIAAPCEGGLTATAAVTTAAIAVPASPSHADLGGAPGATSAENVPRCAARHTATAAVHTATPARSPHRHAHRGALAARRASRRHATPELRAHSQPLRTASVPPAPPAPPRESHPRAALPVLVRPAHHLTWGGGSRLAAALPRAVGMLPVALATIRREEEVRASDPVHEVSEARGPPLPGPIAPTPAFALRQSYLPRARFLRTTTVFSPSTRIPHASDRGASLVSCAARARGPDLAVPGPGSHFDWFVTALPHGRADVRRLESATAWSSWLSSGGLS